MKFADRKSRIAEGAVKNFSEKIEWGTIVIVRVLLAAGICLPISGCLTAQTEKAMSGGLKALKGAHYTKAIEVLGIPTSERSIGDKKVYTWQVGWNESLTLPTVNTATGLAGGTPVTVTSYGTRSVNQSFDCRIDLMTNKQGVVEMTEYDGNVEGCQRYAKRLKEIAPKE